MDEEQLFEEFYERLRRGIPGIESNGGNYNAQNPQGSAAGKYQFTKQWLDEKKFGKDSITAFARNSKVFPVPATMEDFKNNPELQEAYFKHYSKNVLYPKALKTIKESNPLGLSLDQAGALFHFQSPKDAETQIKTGKLSPQTKKGVNGAKYDNVSGAKYINKYTKTLNQQGLEPISKNVTASDKEKEKIINDFKEKDEAINNLDLDQGAKEKLRKNLYQEVVNNGNKSIINSYIDEENKKNEEKYKSARNLENVLENAEVNRFKKTKSVSFNIENKDPKMVEKAMKDYPELFKNAMVQDKGKKGKSIYIPQYNSKDFSNKLLELNKKGEISIIDGQTAGNKIYDLFESIIPEKLKAHGLASTKETIFKASPVKEFTKRLPIGDDIVQVTTIPEVKEEETKSAKEKKADTPKKESDKTIDPNPETNEDYAEQYFNTALGLGGLQDDNFNYTPGKKELPIDAITGLALGLIGNEQAKNANIPLRTEEVSNAMKNYTAELAERSKQGLPVEVEAAMKNQLADAYQGGLANIVNASGGNSATVLGNLGSLEGAKNKGLVAMQIADYEAKDRAFAQYGQAIQYINEFDARRDIANHEIKYGEAKEKQQMGRQLATAGFAKLIDSIKYDRENGPGSANDMYRSMLMQKMFGFDPKMKDDGSGEITGTKSWYDKNKALTQKDYETTKELHQKYGSLNPDQKQAFQGIIKQTTDKDKLGGFIDYLQKNPDIDTSKISMDNLDLALEKNDFGLLSKNRNEILNPSKPVETEQGLTSINTLPVLDENQNTEQLPLLNIGTGLISPNFGLSPSLTLNK